MSLNKKIFGALVFTIASLFIFNSPVFADSKHKIHIGISPSEEKMELAPGDRKVGTFKIQNLGTEDFEYKLSSSPYRVKNENYEADLSTESSYTQISKWISFPNPDGYLKSGETREIEYNISVPNDTPGGGQYAVISAATVNKKEGTSFKSSQAVSMKVIARVAGTTRESGEIIDNKISGFFANPPISANSLVSSSSNVDISAKYSLKVHNFFTNEVAYISDADPNFIKEKTILPDSKYLKESRWEGAPRIGIFKVKHTVELLGKASVVEKIVILCPVWLLVLIIAIFILVVFYIFQSIKSNKTKRQMAGY